MKPGQVLLDPDLKIEELIAVDIKEKRVGFARFHAAENYALRGTDHRVSNRRVCDNHVGGWNAQFDNRRLVDWQKEVTGGRVLSGL